MEVHFLQMKYLLIIHIASLYVLSAESALRLRTGWRTEAGWTSMLHPLPLPADTKNEYSLDTGAPQGAETGPLHGGFGGLRRKKVRRGRGRHFGQFNSDTHSCGGIQTRSCSRSSDCTGCLGLYTCNVILGQCQLKGLSPQTDKFLQSLRGF